MSTDVGSYPAMDAAYNFLSQQKLRHKEGEETFLDMLAPNVLKQTNEFDILYSKGPHQMQIALLEGDAKQYFDADIKQHYLFMPSQKVTVNTMNRINQGLIKAFLRIKPNKPDFGLTPMIGYQKSVNRAAKCLRDGVCGAFHIWYQSPSSFNGWRGFVAVVPLGKEDQAPRWSDMALIEIRLSYWGLHPGDTTLERIGNAPDSTQAGWTKTNRGTLYPHFGEDAYARWKILQKTGMPQSINVNLIQKSGYHQ